MPVSAQINFLRFGIGSLHFESNPDFPQEEAGNVRVSVSTQHSLRGSWSKRVARVSIRCLVLEESPGVDGNDDESRDRGAGDVSVPERGAITLLEVEFYGDFEFRLQDGNTDENVSSEGRDENANERDAVKQLLLANGTAILFPYLRAAISSITMAAGLPPMILPTVNVRHLL